MATMPTNAPTNPDTLVTIKVAIDGAHRRFKVPLRDLGANVFPTKLRLLLGIPPSQEVVFERYSDSAAAFVVLDPNDSAIFKQLYRAAKAKLKLRIKATRLAESPQGEATVGPAEAQSVAVQAQSEPIADKADNIVKPTVTDDNTPPVNDVLAETSVPAPSEHVAAVATEVEAPQADIEKPSPDTATSTMTSATKVPGTATDTERAPETRDAPLPDVDAVRRSILSVAQSAQARYLAIVSGRASNPSDGPVPPASYMVYCNACDRPIRKEYYHCSTCDGGDFDLCCDCIEAGHVCRCDGHWMIRRTIKDGRIINSTTEKFILRTAGPAAALSAPSKIPDHTTNPWAEKPTLDDAARRKLMCRVCLQDCVGRKATVVCTTCPDYRLCVDCLVDMKHGHDPKHAFENTETGHPFNPLAQALCAPGRNRHHYAICDGCDKNIVGVRHKCLDCPDWDYCSICIKNSSFIHPGHRFVAVTDSLDVRAIYSPTHDAKLCDGPLCKNKSDKSYIVGVRYKCVVCHDTDFCGNCEASPLNRHNPTHPLIKFKTPIRTVTVETRGERADGERMPVMGDIQARSMSAETGAATTTASATNSATQVQTVVDVKPEHPAETEQAVQADESVEEDEEDEEEEEEEDEPVEEQPAEEAPVESTKEQADLSQSASALQSESELDAHFVRDTIPDGTVLPPGHVFRQTWTIRNPGPADWPKGCSVKFVGGDNMRNIDPSHPISVAELEKSVESDVLPLDVGTGVNWCFTVTLKTPRRPGKYISYWRLTAPNGLKFGHKLWCEIDVSADAQKARPAGTAASSSSSTGGQQQEPAKLVDDSDQPSIGSPGADADTVANQAGGVNNFLLLERELRGPNAAMSDHRTEVDTSLPFRSRYAASRRAVNSEAQTGPEEPYVKRLGVLVEQLERLSKAQAEGSTMIFPKLDKESPVASQSEDKPAESSSDSNPEHEVAPPAGNEVQQTAPSEVEVDEEEEEMVLSDHDESDEEFLTDEEYDILDASDEEFLSVAQKEARK